MNLFIEMEESMDDSIRKEDTSSLSILQSGSGGPRRRYHRKDAKKKKLEDPNAPRRPRSAYVHFLSAQRAKYGSAKGGVNQREINEMLAAEWRALTDTDRQVFIVKSNLEKEEYSKLMEVYTKTDEYKSFNAKMAEIKRKKKRGESPDEEDVKASSKHKKHGKHHKKDIDCQPREEGIFSEQFVQYNKEQEQSLRNIRRQIGQTEDELDSLKRNSHSLEVNSENLRDLVKRDRMEADRLEDTVSSWLEIVKECIADDELENEEMEAYLEDILDNGEDHKEVIDKLTKFLSHAVFVTHQ